MRFPLRTTFAIATTHISPSHRLFGIVLRGVLARYPQAQNKKKTT